jgi:hypothetical protein
MIEQKIEAFWRDATAEDIAKVMNGENVYARFRDRCANGWAEYYLSGVNGKGWIAGNFRWDLCQVYEPQQWWLDKPDPGEGWRLLGKFPDEPKLATDEFFDTFEKTWVQVGDTGSNQYHGVWYRRRIEPVNPDPGHGYRLLASGEKLLESDQFFNSVGDWVGACLKWSGGYVQDGLFYRRRIEPVKQDAGSTSASNIPKGWTALSDDEPRLESDAYWSQGASEWCLIGKDRVEYANRDKWPAIRQRKFVLVQGESYSLPQGLTLEVYKQGFEVF